MIWKRMLYEQMESCSNCLNPNMFFCDSALSSSNSILKCKKSHRWNSNISIYVKCFVNKIAFIFLVWTKICIYLYILLEYYILWYTIDISHTLSLQMIFQMLLAFLLTSWFPLRWIFFWISALYKRISNYLDESVAHRRYLQRDLNICNFRFSHKNIL